MSAPATLSAETRAPGTVRTNRTLLLLTGLVLLLAGVAGLLTAAGVTPGLPADRAVLSPRVDGWIGDQVWFWPVVAVAAAVLVLVGLRWLLAQGRSDRLAGLSVERVPAGHTDIDASAVTGALVAEIESYRGVRGARAHLHGSAAAPELSLDVVLDGRDDVGSVHRRVVAGAVDHVRTALGAPELPVRLVLHLPKAAHPAR